MSELVKRSILIVDDEPDLVEVMRYYLAFSGIAAVFHMAGTGREALAVMQKERLDVIISDIRMPELTGIEMLREMNRLEVFTPVIFVSGFGDKHIITEAWRLGAFDFLDKPIQPRRLLENVQIAFALGERFNRERHAAKLKAAG